MMATLCQCGREIGPRAHCPLCGTLKCYLMLSRKDFVTRPDGKLAILRVWRCTKCGHKFNDDDWMLRCSAKPYVTGRPAHKPKSAPLAPQPIPGLLQDPAVQAVLREFQEQEAQEEEARRKLSPLEVFNQAKTGD